MGLIIRVLVGLSCVLVFAPAGLAQLPDKEPPPDPPPVTRPRPPAPRQPPAQPTAAARPAADMVSVPAGAFFMGCNEQVDRECFDDEIPGRQVQVGAFRIDRTEVTVARYGACAKAGACSTPDSVGNCNWGQSGRGSHPVNCVDWSQADAFCRWAGKRLPTEAEWEKAARGTDGRVYPWGNAFDSGGANVSGQGTSPVGSFPGGASPSGALDMAGNVWEWTADWYAQGVARSVRGGSWNGGTRNARASNRIRLETAFRSVYGGFRCAQ